MVREVWQGFKTLLLILWLGDNVHPCLISLSPALKCSTTYNTFNLLIGLIVQLCWAGDSVVLGGNYEDDNNF